MKKSAVSLLLLVGVAPTLCAGAAAGLSDKLAACALVQDSLQRLVCFDRLAASAASASSVPESTTTIPLAVAQQKGSAEAVGPATPPPSPGDDLRKQPVTPEAAPEIHAKITRLASSGSSSFLVYLDNGQVWRHEDTVQGAFLRVGGAVTITTGALGSYRMTRDDSRSKGWIRVSRAR